MTGEQELPAEMFTAVTVHCDSLEANHKQAFGSLLAARHAAQKLQFPFTDPDRKFGPLPTLKHAP